MEHAHENNTVYNNNDIQQTEPEVATSPIRVYLGAHIFLLVHQNMQQPAEERVRKDGWT